MNLLTNPSFNEGHHRQDNISEINVPDGWYIYWLDKTTFPGGGQEALRPESIVWYIQNAPEHERPLFFLDGDYCWKVFKPYAPVYFAVTQAVSGLTPGVTYRFNAKVFPDILLGYQGGQKVRPNDIWHAESRVGWSAPDTSWPAGYDGDINWAPWFNMTIGNFEYGAYNDIWFEFVAPDSGEVRIWLECKAKWGGATTENNWFMDAFSLTAVSEVPEVGPEPGPAPGPGPEPPTTPVPGRGEPRVQYERTYLLLPEGLAEDMVVAAARVACAKGITLGFSPDDAGVGNLEKRRVVCVNPDQIGTGLSQAWYDEHYPGVQFIGIQADSASVLETALMAVV